MSQADTRSLLLALAEAENDGYRLEIMDGLGVWEVSPAKRHISAVKRIERSIRPEPGSEAGCACVTYQDIAIAFPGGSLKRPDIAVFCREPDEEDEAVTLIPEAVVEVVSRGSETKDFELNPPFYLRHGVKDVVIVDPYANTVIHHRAAQVRRANSPVELKLECGWLLSA